MFCPKCGAQLPDGSSFCGRCGAQLAARPNGATTPAPTPGAGAAPVPQRPSSYVQGARTHAPGAPGAHATPGTMAAPSLVAGLDNRRLVALACILVTVVVGFFLPWFHVSDSLVQASRYGSDLVSGLSSLAGNSVDASSLELKPDYSLLGLGELAYTYDTLRGSTSASEDLMFNLFTYPLLVLIVGGVVWLLLSRGSTPAKVVTLLGLALLALEATLFTFFACIDGGQFLKGVYTNFATPFITLAVAIASIVTLCRARWRRA